MSVSTLGFWYRETAFAGTQSTDVLNSTPSFNIECE